jgi:hypothetical protein
MARIREMRGGKDYEARFGERMVGSGLWAQLLRQRFHKACERLGLNRERIELDLSQFNRPAAPVPRKRPPQRVDSSQSQQSGAAPGPADDSAPRQASLF